MDENNIIQNLIELNADEWNQLIADKMEIDVSILTDQLSLRQTLSMTEDKINVSMDKVRIGNIARKTVSEYLNGTKWASEDDSESEKYIPPDDRYIKNTNDEEYSGDEIIIESLACYGKVIAGIDFTGSVLDGSFFSGCVFFNCIFSNTGLNNSKFINCIFNLCDFSGTGMDNVHINRSRFIDCVLDRASIDYSYISDTIMIACQFIGVTAMYSHITYSGINECILKGINLKGCEFITSSVISSDFSDSIFKSSSILDSVFMRCDFTGADFSNTSYNLITSDAIKYDGEYIGIFSMDSGLFHPALNEFEEKDDTIDPMVFGEEDEDEEDMF